MKYIKKLLIILTFFIMLVSCGKNIQIKNINVSTYEKIEKQDKEIVYVAIWCPHCQKVLKENKGRDDIVFIFYGDNKKVEIKRFFRYNELDYEIYFDSNFEIAKKFNINQFPTYLKKK